MTFVDADDYVENGKYWRVFEAASNKNYDIICFRMRELLDGTLMDVKFNQKLAMCEVLFFVLEAFIYSVIIEYLDITAYVYRRNAVSVTRSPSKLRESRDEYLASCMIDKLSKKRGIDDFKQISTYWRVVSAMRNLKDVDGYRKKNPQKFIWIYTFIPSYWALFLQILDLI